MDFAPESEDCSKKDALNLRKGGPPGSQPNIRAASTTFTGAWQVRRFFMR